MKFSIIASLVMCCIGLAQAAEVKNVRIWPAPDNVRLVFDLDSPVTHKLFELRDPQRLVVDIANAQLKVDLDELSLAKTPIKRLRSAIRNGNDLRVVLDLAQNITPKSFMLPPQLDYGHRLVIDLYDADSNREAPIKQASVANEGQRDIVVVIDAGHGGEDPGALGPGRIREKVVVLKIAQELEKLLDATPGFSGKLTRTGDYYISLRNRTRLARQAGADLLVSVHADAFHSPKARGASVFALSQRGATSETARWLASRENNADLIGGVGGVSLDDKDDVLRGVLLDLSATASIQASLNVGGDVLGAMGSFARLHKRQVEQAGFVVLKSPDIPSILVETGFISNPEEARKLKTSAYQKKMAAAIHKGIVGYFTHSPPPGTLVAARKTKQALPYTIVRGDTLSGIAKKHHVSVAKLRQLNQLKSDKIRIGQIIRIPTS